MNSGKMIIKLSAIIAFVGGVNFSTHAMNEDQSLYPKRTIQPYRTLKKQTTVSISKQERAAAKKAKERAQRQQAKEASDQRQEELNVYFTEEIEPFQLEEEAGSKRRFKYRELLGEIKREEKEQEKKYARLQKEYNKMGLAMPAREDDLFDIDLEDLERQLAAERTEQRLRREQAAKERRELQRAQQERRRQRNVLSMHERTPMVSKKRDVPVNYVLELNTYFNNGDMDKVNEMLQNSKVRAAVQGFKGYHVTRPETQMLNENMDRAKVMIENMGY